MIYHKDAGERTGLQNAKASASCVALPPKGNLVNILNDFSFSLGLYRLSNFNWCWAYHLSFFSAIDCKVSAAALCCLPACTQNVSRVVFGADDCQASIGVGHIAYRSLWAIDCKVSAAALCCLRAATQNVSRVVVFNADFCATTAAI